MANESAFDNAVTTGRTGVITNTTAYGILLAGTTATSAIQNAGAGTATHVLTSNGAAANPSFQVSAGGGADAADQAEMEAGADTDVYVSPGRQQYHESSSKMWINFNGTGTIAIRDSYNVDSIADNAVGDYTITIDTDFSTADYAVTACGRFSSSNSNCNIGIGWAANPAVGTLPIICVGADGSTDLDCDYVCVSTFGDQ